MAESSHSTVKTKFTVTYCMGFGMLQNSYDKFDYNTLEKAQARLAYLNSLSGDQILEEGFEFVPNYLSIESVTS